MKLSLTLVTEKISPSSRAEFAVVTREDGAAVKVGPARELSVWRDGKSVVYIAGTLLTKKLGMLTNAVFRVASESMTPTVVLPPYINKLEATYDGVLVRWAGGKQLYTDDDFRPMERVRARVERPKAPKLTKLPATFKLFADSYQFWICDAAKDHASFRPTYGKGFMEHEDGIFYVLTREHANRHSVTVRLAKTAPEPVKTKQKFRGTIEVTSGRLSIGNILWDKDTKTFAVPKGRYHLHVLGFGEKYEIVLVRKTPSKAASKAKTKRKVTSRKPRRS